MGRIELNYGRWSRTATTITSPSAAVNAPPSNTVYMPHPGILWQSAEAPTADWIQLETDGALTWDMVAVLYSNLAVGDTWRIRAKSTLPVTTTPTYDTGVMPCFPSAIEAGSAMRPLLHRVIVPRAEAHIRIDFVVATTLRVGAIMIDTTIKPTRNFERGMRLGPPTQLTIPYLPRSEAAALYDVAQTQDGKPLYAVLDPDETDYLHVMSVYGRDISPEGLKLVGSPNNWTIQYNLAPYVSQR